MALVNFVGNSNIANGTGFRVLDQFTTLAIDSALTSSSTLSLTAASNETFLVAYGTTYSGTTALVNTMLLGGTNLSVRGFAAVLPFEWAQNTNTPGLNVAFHALVGNLFAGNDAFDISGSVSTAWGDFQTVPSSGTVQFGDDSFYLHALTLPAGVTSVVIAGDSLNAPAGTHFVAGDDVIDGRDAGAPLTLYGDFVNADASGTYGNDVLTGGLLADIIYGDSPTSTVSGGNDFIDGGYGIDTIYGGGGADHLLGNDGADTVNGGEGDDYLFGGYGSDTLNGGNGFDIAAYSDVLSGVTVSLANPGSNTEAAAGDTFSGIEGLMGSGWADVIGGDNTGNTLIGGGGVDAINGLGGNDIIRGDAGADTMDGGADFDTISWQYGTGATINVATGTAIDGEGSTDTFSNFEQYVGSGFYRDVFTDGVGVQYFVGLGGNDYVISNSGGADVFNGGEGFDTVSFYNRGATSVNLAAGTAVTGGVTTTIVGFEEVYGSNTAGDTIVGDAGNNTFWGFGGNDVLVGGRGLDTLSGGGGNDTFGFNASDLQVGVWDVISDFHEVGNTDRDTLYFNGVAGSSLVVGQANGGVYVSTQALGGNGGVFIANFTAAQLSDQLLFT